ncbi:MAG: bifunctional adenosylcobinamide kinase/adenosylcobinamide-phosphate guanylyltransferase [Parasphingorhabdus sp.]|uniref:bifunctional adenosylcobinamide kinase/adenosylcobinamide-phosphate guanylyltransferase n=1 Tax=Parasphingorhabdus sp. TaxID=2709688 RepID=UPI00300143CE
MTSLLVLGGARSGKSRYAQSHVEAMGSKLAYIATAQALDSEMAGRILRHQSDRDGRWHTIEAPFALPEAITEASHKADAILVDCLTLWLSNLMLDDRDVESAGDALCKVVQKTSCPVALVANEVGLGIVPDNALSRQFRDSAGWLNQKLAKVVEEVIFVAAGLPMRLK